MDGRRHTDGLTDRQQTYGRMDELTDEDRVHKYKRQKGRQTEENLNESANKTRGRVQWPVL
jgi:hypothetical protein